MHSICESLEFALEVSHSSRILPDTNGILDFNKPNYSSLAANSPNFKNNDWQS
ncbi:hypothetical protein Hanom_Chr13g01236041 [Helianthus anomalus]